MRESEKHTRSVGKSMSFGYIDIVPVHYLFGGVMSALVLCKAHTRCTQLPRGGRFSSNSFSVEYSGTLYTWKTFPSRLLEVQSGRPSLLQCKYSEKTN